MKKLLKDFLNEVETFSYSRNSKFHRDVGKKIMDFGTRGGTYTSYDPPPLESGVKFLGEIPKFGHLVYDYRNKNNEHEIRAWNPVTKQVDVSMSTTEGSYRGKRTNVHYTDYLSAANDSQLRAHELYHYLITKHDFVLVSDQQSRGKFEGDVDQGGAGVWRRLARKYGNSINVHGWDPDKKEPVNIKFSGDDADDIYVDQDDPVWKKDHGSYWYSTHPKADKKADKEALESARSIAHLQLVAHRKNR